MGGRPIILLICGRCSGRAVRWIGAGRAQRRRPRGPRRPRPDARPRPDDNNDNLVQQDGDQASGAVGDQKTKAVIVKLKPGASLDDKIAEYEARDDVIIAEENGTMETSDDPTFTSQASQGTGTGATAQGSSLPNDQYLSRQWDLTAIHALEAWNLYSGNFNAQDGAPIAIVDSGVAASSGPPTRARA